MNDFLLIIGAILLWLGGWLAGRASAHRAEEARRKQEEEFAKQLAALHVEPPPPLTEEEKRLIRHAEAWEKMRVHQPLSAAEAAVLGRDNKEGEPLPQEVRRRLDQALIDAEVQSFHIQPSTPWPKK